MNLVKQQLTPNDNGTNAPPVKETTQTGQANHPPTADDLTVTINTTQKAPIKLKGNDADGDALTYSIVSHPSPSGKLSNLDTTNGEVFLLST